MFRLARLSLRNRAVVALTTIAIVIGGLIAMTSLKQELIPSLQIPMAGVIATYPGVGPSVIEQQVAIPLETAVRGVDGVESIETTAMSSMAICIVQFRYGTNMDAANQKLSTAVTRIAGLLPADVDTRVITGSMDDFPVLQLAVSSAGGAPMDATALASAVNDNLVPRLEELEAVRSVAVSGFSPDQITITLDPAAMAAAGITAGQISSVLRDYGLSMPAGTISRGPQTLTVQIGGHLTSAEDIAAIALPTGAGAGAANSAGGLDADQTGAVVGLPAGPVALGDVATVVQASAPATSYSRLDGADAVAIAVTKTPAGNTVEVSHAVRAAIDDLADVLAEQDLRVGVAFDQAPFIERSIQGLATEGLLGLGFAVVIILIFLLSLRSTIVSAISIPLSLLVTFIVMNATGQSLNILTLGALTIAIGRVVDDSIVVIENIKRHLSYGEDKLAAIIGAVREVGGAIAASTVCTVAVFAPIGFVSGMVGELFRPFALTVVIALGASLLVALTIVPVLAYWFVKAPINLGQADQVLQRTQAEAKERRSIWQRAYLPTLRGVLRHPVLTLLTAVLLLGGTAGLATRLETNFLGDMGQDTLTVTQTFEPATSLAVQDQEARAVEAALAQVPEVKTVQTTVGGGGMFGVSLGGTSQVQFSITLADDADAEAAQAAIRSAVAGLGGEQSTGITVSAQASMMSSQTIDLVIHASDAAALAQAAAMVADMARGVENATDVVNNLTADQDAVQVKLDATAIARMGLTETQAMAMVAGLTSPSQLGTIDTAGGRLVVRLALAPAPQTLEELAALPLAAGPAGPIALGDIATLEVVAEPIALTRVNGERSATVSVTPSSQDLGQLSGRLTDAAADLDLPPGARVEIGGVAADQTSAFRDLGLALLIAIAIVFIVMVATFGSLLQPFILLISIPFAATGALAALLVTGTPLGVPAMIGVLMLIGIVVSNAIVLIDLINQYRRQGRPLDEAIAEGARKRLRPILMTAAATIFALAPMAIGITGEGAFISKPLALVVIGGLVSSTLLTLIVVPVLYRFEARAHDRRAERAERRLASRRAERQARLEAEGLAESGQGQPAA